MCQSLTDTSRQLDDNVTMKISVLIPTYNAAAFIQATLDSVLRQTVPPDEVIVLDDGSTDNTVSILNSYNPRITVYQQENKGVYSAHNKLFELAQGELIAFLDHDDIWHPSYLEVQSRHFREYPDAVAMFTGHVNFYGYGNYQWGTPLDKPSIVELMTPITFFRRYNKATGPFASMSYCCVPQHALRKIGSEPFNTSLKSAGDTYLFFLLATLGPIIYDPMPLVAYRFINNSVSDNRLRSLGYHVHLFELLEDRYGQLSDVNLTKEFRIAFASKRREYAKILMGANKVWEARRQLFLSLRNIGNPISISKSLALLFLTFMPAILQPTWPPSHRNHECTAPGYKK